MSVRSARDHELAAGSSVIWLDWMHREQPSLVEPPPLPPMPPSPAPPQPPPQPIDPQPEPQPVDPPPPPEMRVAG